MNDMRAARLSFFKGCAVYKLLYYFLAHQHKALGTKTLSK